MSKDSIVAAEAIVDLLSSRIEDMKMCDADRSKIRRLLREVGSEIKRRKVEKLELELPIA